MPANQYIRSPPAAADMMTTSMTKTTATVRTATASRTTRRSFRRGFATDTPAAIASGTATTSGRRVCILRASAAQLAQLFGIDRPEPLVGLDREGEQQGGDGGLHDHVGQREGLYDGIHGPGPPRDVGEVGRDTVDMEADGEQQHVGRRLQDDQ